MFVLRERALIGAIGARPSFRRYGVYTLDGLTDRRPADQSASAFDEAAIFAETRKRRACIPFILITRETDIAPSCLVTIFAEALPLDVDDSHARQQRDGNESQEHAEVFTSEVTRFRWGAQCPRPIGVKGRKERKATSLAPPCKTCGLIGTPG